MEGTVECPRRTLLPPTSLFLSHKDFCNNIGLMRLFSLKTKKVKSKLCPCTFLIFVLQGFLWRILPIASPGMPLDAPAFKVNQGSYWYQSKARIWFQWQPCTVPEIRRLKRRKSRIRAHPSLRTPSLGVNQISPLDWNLGGTRPLDLFPMWIYTHNYLGNRRTASLPRNAL